MSLDRFRRLPVGDALTEIRLDRRQLLKRSAALGVAVPAFSALLAACEDADDDDDEPIVDEDDDDEEPADDPVETDDEDDTEPVDEPDEEDDDEPGDDDEHADRYGGTLEVALVDELPTFDNHQTTAAIIGFVMWQVYEHLYTYGENFEIIPELAEGQETSEDGMLNTISLRQGVPFHNGDEMTAEDVVTCMERWGQLSGRGGVLYEDIAEVRQVDDYTIEVEMSAPNGVFWALLSRHNQGLAIYPKEVVDAAGLEPIQEFIGTGPYRFVEHVPDSYIHMERFEDFEPVGTEPDGWGGAKYPYVDEIYFRPVPDEAARAAGLQAGDYHILQSTSTDNFQMLDEDPNTVAQFLPPSNILTIQLNTQEGPMADPPLRQAIQQALEHEPILMAAYGDREAFRMEESWMMEELGVWHTDACGEFYSPDDPDGAMEYLDQSEYDGGPLRFTTSEHENFHINTALTAQQQLEDKIGIDVEILVYDWPTLSGEIRQDMSNWEFLTSGTGIRPDPSMFSPMDPMWGSRWDSERKRELLNDLMTETDPDTRVQIWEDIQCLGYEEEVPFINLGKALNLAAHLPSVQGFRPDLALVLNFFWGVWLEEE